MEGKKNIVFGFLFLVITASLGPYMVVTLLPDVEKASSEKQKVLSDLQLVVISEFENTETLEEMTAEEIAKALMIISDLVGHFQAFTPKFVKRYGDVAGEIKKSVTAYIDEVKKGQFPEEKHCYRMKPGEPEKLEELLKEKR